MVIVETTTAETIDTPPWFNQSIFARKTRLVGVALREYLENQTVSPLTMKNS